MIIKTNKDEILDFSHDASNFSGNPEAVFFPETILELQELVKTLYQENTCFTISGNRTGLTGGAAAEKGIIISTSKLNKIIEINRNDKYIITEAGVTLEEIQRTAAENGLLYPPDPTETNCFIGGTIATNASGEKSFKYGATRNFVEELEILLPQGELIQIKRNHFFANNLKIKILNYDLTLPKFDMPEVKNTAGYYCAPDMDIIDLFIGAEGTLGIITKAKLRLVDKPGKLISCFVFFNNEEDALQFITDVKRKSLLSIHTNDFTRLNALAIEFMDKNSISLLKDNPLIPHNRAAAVWFEQETTTEYEDLILNRLWELLSKYNVDDNSILYAVDDNEIKSLKELRHSFPSKVNEYISAHNLKKLGTDTAVPSGSFRAYYKFCKDCVEINNLQYVIYGHFGNSHIHLNILPKDEKEYNLGKEIYNQICLKAVELGGTISAEHGIGKFKRDLLIKMYGEEIVNQMKNIKQVLDPKMLLNSGNIFLP
ncbi:MAG: FAD-binding oxidoreductase [Bacteroidota bacterium]|nr:FAD-binding oxidoreductase [Bacteroidota bacterium]